MKLSLKPLLFLCLLSLSAIVLVEQSLAASPRPPAQPKIITTSAKYRQKTNAIPSTATNPVNNKSNLSLLKKNDAAHGTPVGLAVVSSDSNDLFSVQPNQCNSSVSMFNLKKRTLLASGSSTNVAQWHQQSGAYFVLTPKQTNLTVYYLEPVGPEFTQLQNQNCSKPTTKPAHYEFEPGRKKHS